MHAMILSGKPIELRPGRRVFSNMAMVLVNARSVASLAAQAVPFVSNHITKSSTAHRRWPCRRLPV